MELFLLLLILLLAIIAVAVQLIRLFSKNHQADPTALSSAVRQEITLQNTTLKQDLATSISTVSATTLQSVNQLSQLLHASQQTASNAQKAQLGAFAETLSATQDQLRESMNTQISQLQCSLNAQMETLRKQTNDQMALMERRMQALEQSNSQRLEEIRSSMNENMQSMRQENAKKLDEIRGTVDEKLQETLNRRITESFQTVSQQLEQVYKGLGEMQTLASDVGGLKKVLSGVKTRGILGEIQLGAILEEILSPEQYATNIATIPGSSERVEYAVKLPGATGSVWLPIDSKFPGDTYAHLLEAQDSGDREAIAAAYKNLEAVIRSEAKDIRNKYVEVPHTTAFGILFLPFEGLYAEAVNRGLIESLQRDYQVNVAGPSTMAALLNSLQMGFKTLAIQKRSNEVWEVLGAVKTEFDKFEGMLEKMQTHLNQTSKDLDNLMGTRTRAIQRKLRSVQQLDEPQEPGLSQDPER